MTYGPGEESDPEPGRRSLLGRPVALATALVIVALLGAVFADLVVPGARPGALLAGTLAQALASLSILVRRLRPLAETVAVSAVAVLLIIDPMWRELIQIGVVVWLPLALAAVTVGLVRLAWARTQLIIGGAALGAYVIAFVVATRDWPGAWFNALDGAAPILGGLCLSLAQRLARARRDRMREVERERLALAERVRADERQRLAVAMHDTVTHRLTLLVLHANSLVATTTDDAARAAGEAMSRIGADTLTELRDFLDLLHDPDASHRRGEGPALEDGGQEIDSVEALVDESRTAGQRVELNESGHPVYAAPVVLRTVHRITQEALANAAKHAPGADVTVRIDYGHGRVDLAIDNARPPAVSRDRIVVTGGGRGLAGLDRRVGLLGGVLTSTPTEDGGFRIEASIPTRAVEPHADPREAPA